MKANKTIEDRKYQTTEDKTRKQSSIDSAAHNQTLKQQKQLNGRNHHISININTKCQWAQLPLSKDTIWQTGLKRKIQQSVVYKRPISLTETNTGLG
jgi:hypothetical protein